MFVKDRWKSGTESLIKPLVVKVSSELAAKIGATSNEDFCEKLSAFIDASKKLETAMSDTVTIESLSKQVTDLQTKIVAIQPGITEARANELISAGATAAVKTFAASDEGKKIIGAEASKITTEALAATGTQPVKPAPAAEQTAETSFKNLEAEGKFEEAFALLSPAAKNEFIDAKNYAAFRKAQGAGQIRIVQK